MKARFLFLAFLLSSLSLYAHPVLSGVQALSEEGQFTTAQVRALENEYRQAATEQDRILAAHLLTFARKNQVIAGPQAYVQELLENPHSESVLGQPSFARLLRLRAEDLYERGRFVESERAYKRLAENTEGTARHYAILKEGWCFLNLRAPERAHRLWLQTLRESESMDTPLREAYFEGLGHAFAENPRRTLAMRSEIASVTEEEEGNIRALVRGISQGTLTLTQGQDALIRDLKGTPWSSRIAIAMLALRTAEKAPCRSLQWLDLVERPSASENEAIFPTLAACSQHLSEETPRVAFDTLERLLVPSELKGQHRYPRFLFYVAKKQNREACSEALHWAQEEKQLPFKQAASACVKACESKDIQTELMQLAQNTIESDPAVYLWDELAKAPKCKEVILHSLAENAQTLQHAYIPVLFAEYVSPQSGLASDFLLKYPDLARSEESSRLRFQVLEQLIARKQFATAQAVLSNAISLTEIPHLSDSDLRLWFSYFHARYATQTENMDSSDRRFARALLERPEWVSSPQYWPWMLVVAHSNHQWAPIARALAHTPKNLKLPDPSFYTWLFEAHLEGALDTSNETTPLISEAFQVADAVAHRDLSLIPETGSLPVTQDVQMIRKFESLSRSELIRAGNQKDAVRAFASLATIAKQVHAQWQKRRWQHTAIVDWARAQSGSYCQSSRKIISERSTAMDATLRQSSAFKSLVQFFDQCSEGGLL